MQAAVIASAPMMAASVPAPSSRHVLSLFAAVLLLRMGRRSPHAARTAPGAGTLPGEGDYLEHVLPNDLSWAAQIGDTASMKSVISFGVNVSALDREGLTSLMRAVHGGFQECVQTLLDAGASIAGAQAPHGFPVLHAAAYHARPDIYQQLLGHGADPFELGPDNYSVLHRVGWSAGDENTTKLWEFILAEGQPAATVVNPANNRSALHLAAMYGVDAFVHALLERVAADDSGGSTMRLREFLDLQDVDGMTALHVAANRTMYHEPPSSVSAYTSRLPS